MERQFIINRISEVMGSCNNILQTAIAEKYSSMLIDTYNKKGGPECQKLKMLDLGIKLK